MKRIFAMCLAMIMVLTMLASCGKKGDLTPEETTDAIDGDASDVITPGGEIIPGATDAPTPDAPAPEAAAPERDGQEYVLFGSYPQTLESNDDVCTALEEKAGALPTASNAGSWKSYRYLSAGQKSDYMWYIDLEHEGAKYRGVYFTEYRSYDVSAAGSEDVSFQDDNGFTKGTAYWFKYEPIKWRILSEDGGKALVVSEVILDAQSFNDASMSGNYKSSEIREWLNATFYTTAISEAQQKFVETTTVDNSAATTNDPSNMYACENTDDEVFLLSYADVMNSAYKFSSDSDRSIMGTDYAVCQGLFVKAENGNASMWWLRSADAVQSERVSRVKPDGTVGVNKTNVNTVGVLAAMTISLDGGENPDA